MMERLLSFVVPVYNVESYLSKCLESILDQDIAEDDYEIVVVNDGSSDKSGEIAREYAEKYSNIILINQQNQGLSGARNSGIKVAKGKYIQFVDSDDYLEPNVEKALVDKMEKENLDVLRFNYQNVNEKGEAFDPNKASKLYVDYTDSVCDGLAFLNERLGYACYAVQFVIRTDLVRSIPLFKENIYFEDTEWTPRVLAAANRVTSVDIIVYNYLVRQGSITKAKTIEKKRKIIDDKLALIVSIKGQMVGKSDKRWYEGMISGTVISLLGAVVADLYAERKRYTNKLMELEVLPLSGYHLSKGAMRKRRLINISPLLYCLLIRLSR